MLKKRIKKMLLYTVCITTGTILACAFWYMVTLISKGLPILSAQVPYMILWQILSVGILCGVGTELILGGRECTPAKEKLKVIIHYVFINLAVLVCGYFYDWYKLSISGILLMCLTSVAVYAFTVFIGHANELKLADKMNQKLKERNKDDK